MSVVLSTPPPAFCFSSDLMMAVFTATDYTSKPNYALFFKLYIENPSGGGFQPIYQTRLPVVPGSNGRIEANLGDKLNDALMADIRKLGPDIPGAQATLCQRSCRRYYFEYAESYGDTVSNQPIATSAQYTALQGGLSFRAQFNTSLAALLNPGSASDDRFLKQGSVVSYTRTNQPQYLYFYNTRSTQSNTSLRVKYYYDDTTEAESTLHTFSMATSRKYAFNVGYAALAPTQGKRLVKYDIWLQSASGRRSEIRTFFMDYRLLEYVRYFLNWSAFGGLDTRLCFGQGSTEFELFQKQARKVLKPGYDIKEGQYTVYDVSLQSNFSVATGWMRRPDLLLYRDFYLSPLKYRYVGGLMMPIQVTSQRIAETQDGDHLFAQHFDYRYLYDDHAYTEGDIEEPGIGFGDFFFSGGLGADNSQYNEVDPTVPWWVKSITLADIERWNAAGTVEPIEDTLQTVTNRGASTDKVITTRGTRNTHLLGVPTSEPLPADIKPNEAYVWFGNPGGSTTPPPDYGNLGDLQDVDTSSEANWDVIRFNASTGKWVNSALPAYTTESWVSSYVNSQGFLKAPDIAGMATETWANGRFVTQSTEQNGLAGNKGWTGRHHFTGALAIPQAEPSAPVAGQAYIWFGTPGGDGTPPPEYGNLGDLQDVELSSVANNQFLRYNSSTGKWVNSTFTVDLSPYAQLGTASHQVRNNSQLDARYAAISHTHTISQITGLQSQLDGFAVRAADNTFTARNHFTGALAIPQAEPVAPVAGQAYVWFGNPGSGGGTPTYGSLAGLEDVELSSPSNNQLLRYNSATGKWINWTANYAPASHTHSINQITDLQAALDGKEPVFSKNTAFNQNFGTTANTVAMGNDSRIVNGQTAYGWGNHAGLYLPNNGTYTGQSMNDVPVGSYFAILSTTVTEKPFTNVGAILSLGTNGGQLVFARNTGSDAGRIAFRSTSSSGNMSPFVEMWTTANLANGTTSQYIRGDGSLAAFPTVGNGTLSLSTGTGLTGSASFSANQTSNVTFSVSLADTVFGNIGNLSGNLNDMTSVGYGSQKTAANATLANNYPWEGGGGSLVNLNHGGNYRTQLFNNRGGTRIAIRARTNATVWSGWRELWHNGNIDPVPTSRQINTGDHLDGGGTLTANRSLSVRFTASTWVVDTQGNPRLYFESSGAANHAAILRASNAGQSFRFRSASNSNVLTIHSETGAMHTIGKITCPVIEPAALIVPSAPPSNPESGKRYIWFS